MASHAKKTTGNKSGSSLLNAASNVKIPHAMGRAVRNAHAAPTAPNVASSDVRPLVHRTAVLMPWKFSIHIEAAASAIPEGNPRR